MPPKRGRPPKSRAALPPPPTLRGSRAKASNLHDLATIPEASTMRTPAPTPDLLTQDFASPPAVAEGGLASGPGVNDMGLLDERNSVEGAKARTTRAGRLTKVRKDSDTVYGEEAERSPSATGKGDEDFVLESPPPTHGTKRRHRKRRPATHTDDDEPDTPAAEQIITHSPTHIFGYLPSPTHPPPPPHLSVTHAPFTVPSLTVDPTIHELFRSLRTTDSSLNPPIDLPTLTSAASPNAEAPYSATMLTHLYILAHDARAWHLCDLVVDTWIRALHSVRRAEERRGESQSGRRWRRNGGLERQRASGHKGFVRSTEDLELITVDPLLEPDVTLPSPVLLNALYAHTPRTCGARLLWADTLALSGAATERTMTAPPGRYNGAKHPSSAWHPELIWDVMCTALRMVRRKLTLRVEEGGEGAWCSRYHEHGRYGGECYRAVAAKWREGEGEEESDEDEEKGIAGNGVGAKRSFGKAGEVGEGRKAKRVRFGEGDDM